MTEAQLIQLLKSGNQKDFRVLYKRFSAALYGVLVRIVHDEELAQDVLQEGFVKIWKNAQAYDPKRGTVFTWMLNICRNQGIDYLRSRHGKARAQSFTLDDNVSLAESSLKSAEPEMQGVLEQVGHLPEPYRYVIDMVYVQGYTQAEVAEISGIPLGTVKTRIRSAIQRLRDQILVCYLISLLHPWI